MQEVSQPEGQSTAVVVQLGRPGEATQDLCVSGLVEPLDLAVALRIAGGAEDEIDPQARADGCGVVGAEPWTIVEEERGHQACALNDCIKAEQKQGGALGRP